MSPAGITARTRRATGLFGRCRTFLSLVRFSHTLFAMPWAVAGLFLGARGWPEVRVLGWVAVAMVGARTAAMAWNRLVDRSIDASNARTRSRPSATGLVTPGQMALLVLLSSAIFVLAAWSLNPLCGALSPVALAVVLFYSYTKRFTVACHFVLGLGLGLAPLGAYLAARGTFDAGSAAAAAMGAAVLAWTAGFDILYACQDVEHDRRLGLHSVPARLGMVGALRVARACHAFVPIALALAGALAGLGPVYFGGVLAVVGLLVWEHRLVAPGDLSRIDRAFFHANVAIGFVVMAVTVAGVLLASAS